VELGNSEVKCQYLVPHRAPALGEVGGV
jgi:hypothetical protein